MSHVVLVRHGRATAGWDADPDPGLDEVGHAQATAMAEALHLFGPLPLYTSPLRRCRETAAALERRWGVEAIVNPAVGEIESPSDDLAQRGAWLRGVMGGQWSEQADDLRAWRQRVIDGVLALEAEDAVVVSHFIAINAIVGEATGDDRVVTFAADNCSWSEVIVDAGRIEVVELGRQAPTIVQ